MNRMISFRSICGAAAVGFLAFCRVASAHDEFFIGHTAEGKLAYAFSQSEPLRLFLVNFPGINGWGSGNLGIESVSKDDAQADLFMLPDNVNIKLVLESADTNMHLFNEDGSGFVPVGGTFQIGSPFFHMHPFWNLTSGRYGTIYQIQVSFIDTSGQFTQSDTATIQFVPECPGDVNLSTAVDTGDLLAVINSWGDCPDACETVCAADLDFTCTVNVADLLIVINSWGPCVPP